MATASPYAAPARTASTSQACASARGNPRRRCTYHVMHPGGRSYDTFPVNAYEAEARRHIRFHPWSHQPGSFTPPPWVDTLSRFVPEGHGIGPVAPPPEQPAGEHPHTLDPRR